MEGLVLDLSRLEMLPTELVQKISGHLDFSDKRHFSAASQQLHHLIVPIQPSTRREWYIFLLCTARDHADPNVRICEDFLELVSWTPQMDYIEFYNGLRWPASTFKELAAAMRRRYGFYENAHRCWPQTDFELGSASCL